MGILSRALLRERLSLPISEARSIVVTPLDQTAMDSDTIDVRLGSHFLFPPLPSDTAKEVQRDTAKEVQRKTSPFGDLSIHVPHGQDLILPARQNVLGVTLEFIKLPFDLSGQILTKSSVARNFLVIETAPWIHPSYRGCLTLEIANVSDSALVLRPGMRIGQLIFMTIDNPEPEDRLQGSFIGPVRPEPPTAKQHSHQQGNA